ncbi:DUF488 family protein (plasmid) [Brevibacillus halotolerans]|nr:DUF488 family protein [Brevibacillus halotolerans]
MLILSYLGEANKFDLETGLNLLTVRNPPTDENGRIKIPTHFIHVPQLSPSKALFSDTQTWKKCDNKLDWWHLYAERFLKEMKERNDMVRALHRLNMRLRQGELVRVFCYCKDVCYCHRSFIGKDMENRGHKVDFRPIVVFEQISFFQELLDKGQV